MKLIPYGRGIAVLIVMFANLCPNVFELTAGGQQYETRDQSFCQRRRSNMLQTEARELRCQEHDQQMKLQGSFCKRKNVFIRIYAHW